MVTMMLAATTAFSWLGVVVIGLLLSLLGRGVVRLNARQVEDIQRRELIRAGALGPSRRPVVGAAATGAAFAFAVALVWGGNITGVGVMVAAVALVAGAADRCLAESQRAIWVTAAMPVMVCAYGIGAALH